ncbi:hypothetical protein O9992_30875 [Vibrio lentus]|nr:hypothetical protein [Vibrio lentus]
MLKEQGINADEVIKNFRDEYMQTMKASAEAITTEFGWRCAVRVPGFIVPLEFSEGQQQNFINSRGRSVYPHATTTCKLD